MLIFCKKKMLRSAKLRRPSHRKVYFPKLHMYLYLCITFQVSSIILTSFRQGGDNRVGIGEGKGGVGVILLLLPSISKQTPKNSTQIRVKKYCSLNILCDIKGQKRGPMRRSKVFKNLIVDFFIFLFVLKLKLSNSCRRILKSFS